MSNKIILKPTSVRSRATKITKENPEKIINEATKIMEHENSLDNIETTIIPVQTSLDTTTNKVIDTSGNLVTETTSQITTMPETNTEQTLEVKYIKFTPQEIMFYNKVNGFFRTLEEKKFKHMVDILNGEADISLRLLEWFITKYCDKYRTTKCNKENGESFVIYVGYKAALKTYRKRYFDPFKRNQQERKQKFCYVCKKITKEYRVNTTLGQLHFFRWLFENNILNYVIKNFDTIKASMEHTNRLEKKRKDEDKKNGIKKIKNKTQHKKFNKSSASSSVEINTHDTSKGKSSLVISFD